MTIQELIDASLVKPDRIRSGKWNPSSFGQCYRQQYWNRKNETPSNPPGKRSLRVFACGQLFHDLVQNAMTKFAILDGQIVFSENDMPFFKKEVLVESDDVKGYADLVGENEVIDIKSQHSKSFWYMSKFKGDDIKKEKYGNWLQVIYYAMQLNKEFARLVFVSKDDLSMQEYVQPVDYDWRKEVDAELKTLRQIWTANVLPPALPRCEPNKKGEFWQCTYCKFKNKCYELEAKNE